jgi:fructose-specific phosphotransferase system IIA component
MKISDIITIDSIKIKDNTDNKFTLISELVEIANNTGNIINKESALADVLEREKVLSTGVGKSIALPHAKTEHIRKSTGSLILVQEPVDYDSLDDEPVKLAILLLSQSSNISLHLKLLSQISRLLNNDSIRNNLFESTTKQEIFDTILKFEESTTNSNKKEYLYNSSK